jgi:glycyl-tRNA synthetase beta subunit
MLLTDLLVFTMRSFGSSAYQSEWNDYCQQPKKVSNNVMRCADGRRTTLKLFKPLQKLMHSQQYKQESNRLVEKARTFFASDFFVHLSSDAVSKHVRQAVETNGLLALTPG